MCGITGKISFGEKDISEAEIELMNEAVAHRGPDDEGVYISKNHKLGLGHRRLSIIDLSSRAHQPMNYMNRYWIVFNGEIYNFLQKKRMLLREGYRFKSRSDTEVIMALYDRFGVGCLKHLRGMFSFAIYDEKEKILFCARDRVGMKPFKYYIDNNVFIFASELKAILTQKEYKREPDYVAIHHYLTLQYVPSPLTGFKGIKKLEPARFLYLDLETKKMIKKRYWKLDYSKKLDLSEDEWKKKIMKKLEESVRLRMISDVPLGAFLSGGIDSSAIVGLMSRLSSVPVKTFSIGFKEKKYDELKFAEMVAKKFKTDHTGFVVKPDTIEVLPMLVKQYEEPYADSSALPTYCLSKLTKKYVTVALNGDGGDENFAGYPWYPIQKFSLQFEKSRWINRLLIWPIINNLPAIKSLFWQRVGLFSSSLDEDYRKRYVNYLCYFSNQMKNDFYKKSFWTLVAGHDSREVVAEKFDESGATDKIDQTLFADINSYLPDDLLVKVDIASMSTGLECRSPFLDHEMLELSASIPGKLKLKGLTMTKYIFKKTFEDFLPKEILYRKKMGFRLPIDSWFRGDLEKYASDILLRKNSFVGTILRISRIQKMLSDHEKYVGLGYGRHLWALLMLELWYRHYFDGVK